MFIYSLIHFCTRFHCRLNRTAAENGHTTEQGKLIRNPSLLQTFNRQGKCIYTSSSIGCSRPATRWLEVSHQRQARVHCNNCSSEIVAQGHATSIGVGGTGKTPTSVAIQATQHGCTCSITWTKHNVQPEHPRHPQCTHSTILPSSSLVLGTRHTHCVPKLVSRVWMHRKQHRFSYPC